MLGLRKVRIKLADLLKDRKMTQAELAKLSEVRPNAISNLCRGYVDRISIEHIEKLCEALQLKDVSELFELVVEEKA